MANRNGRQYGLTVMSPILMEPWHEGLVESGHRRHDTAVRAILRQLPTGPDSPFARIPETHMARWVVWDDVYFSGYPAREEHLKSSYLMLTSDFTGELDSYLDAMVREIPALLDEIYQHCVGYPGVGDDGRSQEARAAGFRDYVRRCQIKTTFLFSDYPQASVTEVLRALGTQRAFTRFFAATQGQPADELQRQFLEFADAMREAPVQKPGST